MINLKNNQMRILIIKAFEKSGYITGTEHEIDKNIIENIKLHNEIKILEEDKPVVDKPKKLSNRKAK
tara:strand:- start:998 stop:1198 length:201 start_codon:yes stop_codon:yes gene_type:complete